MEVIQIEGGRRVTGEVSVEGAKNSALKLMAATIMAPGVSTLTNVPNISARSSRTLARALTS